MKVWIFHIMLGILMLGPFYESSACECGSALSFLDAFDVSDSIFMGVAVGAKKGEVDTDFGFWRGAIPVSFISFEVFQVWKGQKKHSIEIVSSYSNCDYNFKIGSSYLVFATRDSLIKSDNLTSSFCLPTKHSEEAADFLRELGPGQLIDIH